MTGLVGLEFKSKTELVLDHLRRSIQSGRYRPGERLVVSRVAAELGVSKVPVREAVTRLTGEGLVELRPNVGPVIPAFTATDVSETAVLRVAVEAVALEAAVPLHDEDSLAECQRWLDAAIEDKEAFPELNVRFHAALVAPAPYPLVREHVEALLRRVQRFSTVHRIAGYRTAAHEEHVELLAAVAAGDVATAKRLNEAHIRAPADQLVGRVPDGPSADRGTVSH